MDCPYVVTYFLLCIVILNFSILRHYRLDASSFALSYKKVVEDSEYWRVCFAWLIHDEILHLTFNIVAIWSQRNLESYYGSFVYAQKTFLLYFLSNAVYLLIVYRLTRGARSAILTGLQSLESTGYTGVVLAWTIIQAKLPQYMVEPTLYLLGVLPLSPSVAPSIMVLLVQALVWNSSAFNHISGLVTGYLVVLGAFDWFTQYYYFCALQWIVVGFFVSKGFPPQIDTEQIAEQRRAEEMFSRMV